MLKVLLMFLDVVGIRSPRANRNEIARVLGPARPRKELSRLSQNSRDGCLDGIGSQRCLWQAVRLAIGPSGSRSKSNPLTPSRQIL
eukprot:3620984-Rhodomonas_salina.1